MEQPIITATTTYLYSKAEVKAHLTEEDGVEMWFYYPELKQKRHESRYTREEWDRLVAWVEWQRKEKLFQSKDQG